MQKFTRVVVFLRASYLYQRPSIGRKMYLPTFDSLRFLDSISSKHPAKLRVCSPKTNKTTPQINVRFFRDVLKGFEGVLLAYYENTEFTTYITHCRAQNLASKQKSISKMALNPISHKYSLKLSGSIPTKEITPSHRWSHP
jgi:hypothetical protein